MTDEQAILHAFVTHFVATTPQQMAIWQAALILDVRRRGLKAQEPTPEKWAEIMQAATAKHPLTSNNETLQRPSPHEAANRGYLTDGQDTRAGTCKAGSQADQETRR